MYVTINGKQHNIPRRDRCTARQLSKVRALNKYDLLHYISICTGMTIEDVAKVDISLTSYETIDQLLGSFVDYTSAPIEPLYYCGEKYTKENLKLNTFGQRYNIEENAKDMKGEELICYILAVSITGTMDYDSANEIKEELMDRLYLDVLPMGFFLLTHLMYGRKRGRRYLTRWWYQVRTRIKRCLPGMVTLRHIPTTWPLAL